MGEDVLKELQARQAVQRLHKLRAEIDHYGEITRKHCAVLASKSFDARVILEEAGKMRQVLINNLGEFQKIKALTGTLSRSLSSRPPAGGGMPPAAKWGNEFRAVSKQFIEAVMKAEKPIRKLEKEGYLRINAPTRTDSSPDGWFEFFVMFVDLITKTMEACKKVEK